MHVAAREFVQQALAAYGPVTGSVVEFGSQNVNGEVRSLFSRATSYLGVDIHAGPGVDVVQDAAEWRPQQSYQCIISTETFEHTPRWRDMLRAGAAALAPDGAMIVTCASGTRRPHSATQADRRPDPGEYYKNVQASELRQAADALGLTAAVTTDETRGDLYAVLRHRPPAGPLQIIGAGMWRTGTVSLKKALEQLTGKPAHHMTELLQKPAQLRPWLTTVRGGQPSWPDMLRGYNCTLDWPSMAFWRELHQAYPRALVLLSTRNPEEWWHSVSQTVLQSAPTRRSLRTPWDELVVELFERFFVGRAPTRAQAIAAYNRHNELVRATVPYPQLLEWQRTDGWLPLCRALDVPVPEQPFPHLNTTATYRRNHHLS